MVENKNQDELSEVIKQQFIQENERHKYTKKEKKTLIQHVRPLLFSMILIITLLSLLFNIRIVIMYFFQN
jgi:hypothetical protein